MFDKIKNKLDMINNEVYFLDDTHEYWVKGVQYNSVSSTLEYFSRGFDKIPKEILDKAVTRGNAVHKALEDFINTGDIEVEDEYLDYVVNGVSYITRMRADGWKALSVEQKLFSVPEKVCGMVDLILYKETKTKILLKVVDWKTGSLRMSHYAQVSLYKYMLEKCLKRLKIANMKISTQLVSLK